jgi:transcriptional regulator with XRE-family HTH domain
MSKRQPLLQPNIRWSLLGKRLRLAREAKGLTGKDVERYLRTFVSESPTYQRRPGAPVLTARGTTESTVYRQESGQTKVKNELLAIYSELYRPDFEVMAARQVDDETQIAMTPPQERENKARELAQRMGDDWAKEIESWRLLAELARVKGLWAGGTEVGPSYRDFVEVESTADELRTWQPQVIPGLLQTRTYSHNVIKAAAQAYTSGTYDSETLLRWREQRKDILRRGQPPQIRAVVDEAAIRRPMGGTKVMTEQLRHLIELSERDHLAIQVLPFSTGAHTGLSGAFDLMAFGPWTIVFREGHGDGTFVDDDDQVRIYQARYELLQIEALSAEASREYLQQALADL